MPTHLYIPGEPTPLIDRLRAHPLEFAVTCISAVCGLVLAGSAHHLDNVMPLSGLAQLDPVIVYLVAIFLGVGGSVALYGVLVRRDNIRRELNIEQMGWLVQMFGWVLYTVPTVLLGFTSIFGVIIGTFLTIGCLLRFDALRRVEQKLVASVNKTEGDGAHHGV
jgi:hypothetical protein